jgi:prophage antirepressor-like protein
MDNVMIIREWYDDEDNVIYPIRFVKVNDIWYAVLKDVCDAVGLSTWGVSQRMETKYLLKRNIPDDTSFQMRSHSKRHLNGYIMTLISEQGIYKAFAGGKKLRARKFTDWWTEMVMKLRQAIGLEAFQCFDMMDEKVQKHINEQLDKYIPEFDPYGDDIYYDEETGKLMKSVTLPGGDVEQVEYDGNDYQVIHY